MDTSVGSSCSETTSSDNQTEDSVWKLAENVNKLEIEEKDSVMMARDECNTMDTSIARTSHDTPIEGSRIPLEEDVNRIDLGREIMCQTDTSPTCPAGGSTIMSEKGSNSLKIGTQHLQDHEFHPRVENRAGLTFTEGETALLNKYLKFIIEPKINENLTVEFLLVAYLAVQVGDLKKNQLWRLKAMLWDIITDEKRMMNQKYQAYELTIKSINKKLSEGNAVARKADEGDCIVIINKDEYIRETESYFEENCISEISQDNTDNFRIEINKYLEREDSFFRDNNWKNCQIRVACPTAPELIPLIKVNKDKISIRPFVNRQNSPAYKLTMMLDKLLTDNYVFSGKYTVSSSMALINEIKDKQITDSSRFASLDIRNIYANVPVAEAIGIVKNNLTKNGRVSEETINKIVKLLMLVAEYNCFSFNNKFYKCDNGWTLGSSLSDTMADIFINNLEQEVLTSGSHSMNKIVYYGRRVDKILLLVDGTQDDINNICSRFTAKIDIIVKHESNNCIQFLDLDIKRLRNQLSFNVFWEPTITDVVIPSDSCHPQKDKEAAFRSLLDRAYNIPMSEKDRDKELNIIKQIAQSNGYESTMVDQLRDEERRKKDVEQVKDKRKTVTAPYYGEISEELVDIFKPFNVKFNFQAKNLEEYDLRIDLGYRNRKWEQPGVYKFKCTAETCIATYIGETGRQFLVRYNENVTVKGNKVRGHIFATGHKETGIENNLEVLHIEKNKKRRKRLEAFQIALHKVRFGTDLLNKQQENVKNMFFKGFIELLEH